MSNLPHFSEQIKGAINKVDSYLSSTPKRPFNSLILGPPGAGKSYFAKKIREEVIKKTQKDIEFIEVNFADVADYTGVSDMLKEINKHVVKKKIPFVLVDEFDVSLQGSSLIRFLINPMFGGDFFIGGAPHHLETCIFVFCGSYLRSRVILNEVSGGAAEVDILSLYFDLMLHYRNKGINDKYRQKKDMFDSLCQAQALPSRFTNQSAVGYLLRLEKLQDFLSRINGFIIEIPDLAAPLEICKGMRFNLTKESFSKDGVNYIPNLSLSKADEFQNIFDYWNEKKKAEAGATLTACAPYEPLIQYKVAIITERLERVREWLKKLDGDKRKELTPEEWAYLGTIWLKHGMRSLETIFNSIQEIIATDKSFRPAVPPPDVLRSHVVEDYGGPLKLYKQFCQVHHDDMVVKKILGIAT